MDTLAAAAKVRVAKLEKWKSLAAVREEAGELYKKEISQAVAENNNIACPKKAGVISREIMKDAALSGKSEPQKVKERVSLAASLQRPGLNFICECKKASPSKGLISPEFPYLEIAKAYEAGGAAAISCLTEPEYFLGADEYLQKIAAQVNLPVLRKDFTVSEYQIYEAKTLGAGAVLLICAILSPEQLQEFRLAAESVGLDALVETHDAGEVATALQSGAKIIGINNRNLKDFTVDINTCIELRKEIPADRICIAESGIRDAEEIRRLKAARFNGVLIGETLMRSGDPEQELGRLRNA